MVAAPDRLFALLESVTAEADVVMHRSLRTAANLPTVPVPGFEVDPYGRATYWVDTHIDWHRIGRVMIEAIATSSAFADAEAVLAEAVGLDGAQQESSATSPSSQLLEAFLIDYFREAHGDAVPEQAMPAFFSEPQDAALATSRG